MKLLNNIKISLIGSIASVLALLYALLITMTDDSSDSTYPWIKYLAFSILFVFVFYILLISILSKDVHFTNNFSKYCKSCSKMIKKSKGTIYTIQTPNIVNGEHTQAFNKYLESSIRRILLKKNGGDPVISEYKRLIVVDKQSYTYEIDKTKKFLSTLFRLGSSNGKNPSLGNIKICIVHSTWANFFFSSNIDIHITSDSDYALAFQKYNSINSSWSSSVHIRTHQLYIPRSNIEVLKDSFDKIWTEGQVFDFKKDYSNQPENLLNEQSRVINTINNLIYNEANKY